jgi:hypothetical protein
LEGDWKEGDRMEGQGLPNERRYMRIVLGLVVLLVLGGCGSTPDTPTINFAGKFEGYVRFQSDNELSALLQMVISKNVSEYPFVVENLQTNKVISEGDCELKGTKSFYCTGDALGGFVSTFIGVHDGEEFKGNFSGYGDLGVFRFVRVEK